MSEAFEKGIKAFGELLGEDMAEGVRHYSSRDDLFGNLQSRWAVEWAFGTIWTRDELPRKLRSCALLGMLIGMGNTDELKIHTGIALKNGLTREEIQEIYYTAIPYCGLPLSNKAKAAMIEAFREIDEAAAA
jgi:alkylhydroperoxidase/carboxymuconolactone decarboxylase family protein YurZ